MLTKKGMLRSIVVVLVAWLGGFVTAQVAGTSKPQAEAKGWVRAESEEVAAVGSSTL